MESIPHPDIFFEEEARKHRLRGAAYKDILANCGKMLTMAKKNPDVLITKGCYVIVPRISWKVVGYRFEECRHFVMTALQECGYEVTIDRFQDNRLYVSWAHIVPGFVRDEIRAKTGLEVTLTGEVVPPEPDPVMEAPTHTPISNRLNATDAHFRFGASPYDLQDLNAIQSLQDTMQLRRK